MRFFLYSLLLLTLLILVPIAAAQDGSSAAAPHFYELEEGDTITLDELIHRYGCPVGIREANLQLEIHENGSIAAGQIVTIPTDAVLCSIDYTGEIEFLDFAPYYDVYRDNHPNDYFLPLSEFAAEQNVCEDLIRLLNPEWQGIWQRLGWGEMFYIDEGYPGVRPRYIRIPADAPACFETLELAEGRHPRDLAQELNLCEQILWYYNPESIYTSSQERRVYIPLDRQPCYLDGQLLSYEGYPNQWGDYVPAEEVVLEKATTFYEYAIENTYCARDLQALNRHQYIAPLRDGDRLYIPESARHCDYVQEVGTSLIELAREYNVCIETLIDINEGISSWAHLVDNNSVVNPQDRDAYYGGVFVPTEESPCYDENGLRLGQHDRAVHETSKDEWLFAIAQDYGVCMADLVKANPLLATYPASDLPSLIFIPNGTCSEVADDGFVHHQIQAPDESSAIASTRNLMSLSYIYNVCPSDILEANPGLISAEQEGYISGWFYTQDHHSVVRSYWLNEMEVGQTILIPADRLPCYDYQIPLRGIGHYQFVSSDMPLPIDYVCYAQEVNPDNDYTGHEPVISPVPYSEEAYCYNRLEDPRIVLNNESYTLYPFGKDAYLFELAACFGADGYAIIRIEAEDLGQAQGDWYSDAYWGIPNATKDCALIGDDYEAAMTWKHAFYDEAGFGQINENGLYAVTYGDTLTDIGRRYGYLPAWIKAENNMSEDWVYPYQLLRLPSYPNLYQSGSVVGGLLGLGLLGFGVKFILRLRDGRKGKRKNDE
jgi:hypothetical protein